MIKRRSHTTTDERQFLDEIGTYSEESSFAKSLGKIKILENYIVAMDKRNKWGDIDRDEVLTHAVKVLRKFRRGA